MNCAHTSTNSILTISVFTQQFFSYMKSFKSHIHKPVKHSVSHTFVRKLWNWVTRSKNYLRCSLGPFGFGYQFSRISASRCDRNKNTKFQRISADILAVSQLNGSSRNTVRPNRLLEIQDGGSGTGALGHHGWMDHGTWNSRQLIKRFIIRRSNASLVKSVSAKSLSLINPVGYSCILWTSWISGLLSLYDTKLQTPGWRVIRRVMWSVWRLIVYKVVFHDCLTVYRSSFGCQPATLYLTRASRPAGSVAVNATSDRGLPPVGLPFEPTCCRHKCLQN